MSSDWGICYESCRHMHLAYFNSDNNLIIIHHLNCANYSSIDSIIPFLEKKYGRLIEEGLFSEDGDDWHPFDEDDYKIINQALTIH